MDRWVRKIPWSRAWQLTPVFLPGDTPWTEEPGRLDSLGSQRIGHNLSDLAHMHAGERKERQKSGDVKVRILFRLMIVLIELEY